MTIYTRRGDDGRTDLRTTDRVSKASTRIDAYGTVDELNAVLGCVRSEGDLEEKVRRVQHHLHVLQADLANPDLESGEARIGREHVETLERWIDSYDDELEPLTSFILPGGSPLGGALHHARTVCRRAERRAVSLAHDEPVNDYALTYLNRLSDLLFVLARVANARAGVEEMIPEY